MTRKLIVAMAAAAALAGPLAAQSRAVSKLPPGHMPPAGMCRIWLDGVPPGRQPAPTDCRTAELNRPVNARVIYGASSSGTVWRNGLKVTRERDALGRVIYRDANGRVVTRERTSDGWIIWRDANGNVLKRERLADRRSGHDDDDRDNRMSKAEKERRKAARKAEKARGDRDHDDDHDDDDDDDRRKSGKGKKGKG